MNRIVRAAAALGLVLFAAACAGKSKLPALGPSAKPAIVFVRPFAIETSVVTLDPGFGFTLAHGFLPRTTRARALARAVQFILADALEEHLQRAGLAATRGRAMPRGARSALVIGGQFRALDQGAKRLGDRARPSHGGSRVAVDAWVAYLAPGKPAQRLLDLHEDSDLDRRRAERPADANADAALVGRRIADAILALARTRGWLGAGR
jgi:hypothetical protein